MAKSWFFDGGPEVGDRSEAKVLWFLSSGILEGKNCVSYEILMHDDLWKSTPNQLRIFWEICETDMHIKFSREADWSMGRRNR